MFTGIVTEIGRIRCMVALGDTRIEIEAGADFAALETGASVCCAGVCLTVIETGTDGDAGWFAVTASAETLARTTLGDWRDGTGVNLERAMKVGDELGGHMVSGHVDGVAVVLETAPEGESRRFFLEAPEGTERLIAAKGSVALDGVSLTVNEVEGRRFGVNVIPHTLSVTTLDGLQPGDRVNLEIDLLARYVARLLESE